MHFNTINGGILDLSEMAIRANKALRGRSGVLSVRQAGNSRGRVRRADKTAGWKEHGGVRTYLNGRQTRHGGCEASRGVPP